MLTFYKQSLTLRKLQTKPPKVPNETLIAPTFHYSLELIGLQSQIWCAHEDEPVSHSHDLKQLLSLRVGHFARHNQRFFQHDSTEAVADEEQWTLLCLRSLAEGHQSIQQCMCEFMNALFTVASTDSSVVAIRDEPRLWDVFRCKVS